MWIEILKEVFSMHTNTVILYARMWIEMVDVQRFHNIFIVILLVRMWIEVLTFLCRVIVSFCHSSREEMD